MAYNNDSEAVNVFMKLVDRAPNVFEVALNRLDQDCIEKSELHGSSETKQ